MNDNAVVVRFYSRSTLEELPDPAKIGKYATGVRYDASYPGGYGSASFLVPCDPTMPMPFSSNDVVRFWSGPRLVWEGYVGNVGYWYNRNERGVRVSCSGFWGNVMSRRTKEKRWADNRMTQDAWYEPATAYDANDQTLKQMCSIDRVTGRMRFTPRSEAFAANQYHRLKYQMPTGETVKRIKASYNMQEGAQAWEIGTWSDVTSSLLWAVTSSGAFTRDDTLATPSNSVWLYLASRAAQTAKSDATYYGQIDDAVSGGNTFMVYSETGNINAYEVFRDVRAMVPELSANEHLISSALTVSVEPFMTQGREALSSILARIAGYGTSSYGAIGYGVRDSSHSMDGKPILFSEPWPVLTDYDWEININDATVEDGFEIVQDTDSIVNWVVVAFQDATGKSITMTPDDDATLKDAASIAAYGERHLTVPLNLGRIGQAAAVQYGRAFLARSKDPRVYVSGPILYRGSIPGKGGTRVPVANAPSEVTTGVRAKIINFATDTIGVAGAGLTAVVTNAEYSDDNGGEVRISFGMPDDLAVMLSRIPVLALASQTPSDATAA